MQDDRLRLQHMFDAINEILSFIKGKEQKELDENRMLSLAIVKLLEIIGEASKKLSKSFKDNHPNIPWRKMTGLRDIIIHHYYELDDDIIWNVIQDELPRIEEELSEDDSKLKNN